MKPLLIYFSQRFFIANKRIIYQLSKKKTWLWQVEKESYPVPSYIFGTVHSKDKRAFQYLDPVYEKILAADIFANEFNLEKSNELQDPNQLMLPHGQTLEDLIGAKKYARVEKQLSKQLGINLNWFQRAYPITLMNAIEASIQSSDMPDSLDMMLYQFAKENDKIIEGIETVEEQVSIFQRLPIKTQAQSLVKAATNLKKYRAYSARLFANYENFETKRLHKIAKKGIGNMRKILLYDRNIIMADRIDQFANDRSIFAAIGAGHLFGKKGVLKLLKDDGAKISPIKMKK